MKNLLFKLKSFIYKLRDLPLLIMRLILAYGFYEPATRKWQDISGIGDWFASLGIPAPHFQAYLAATTEMAGVILLTLGLGIRFITVPLMIVMAVAIKTVHWHNGFAASDNGYEIPLYYLIMLFTLFVYGGGKISIDFLLSKLGRNKEQITM